MRKSWQVYCHPTTSISTRVGRVGGSTPILTFPHPGGRDFSSPYFWHHFATIYSLIATIFPPYFRSLPPLIPRNSLKVVLTWTEFEGAAPLAPRTIKNKQTPQPGCRAHPGCRVIGCDLSLFHLSLTPCMDQAHRRLLLVVLVGEFYPPLNSPGWQALILGPGWSRE